MPARLHRGELFDEDFLRRLRHLAMAGRRILAAAGGAHRATDLGDGLEFADHRDYCPGDELRYVDWNAFGRLDRLQIRLFHRHSEQQVHLLVDCSASMTIGLPSKEIYAKRCAAALAYLARANLDHVAIAPWSGDRPRRELAPVRGRAGRFATILDYLAEMDMEPSGVSRLSDAARQWVRRPRQRGLGVLISDCADLDDLNGALRRVARAVPQVAVLHVYSPADAGQLPGGPLALADPEQRGPSLRLTHDTALRQAFGRQWANYLARARSIVQSAGGVHVHTSTARPWEKFLLGALRLMRLATV